MLDFAAEGLEDPTAVHARLVNAWDDLYDLPDAYAWKWVGRHLEGAGKLETLRELLLDFAWMQKKLANSSLLSLVSACERFPEDAAMRSITRALRLSMQAIANDPRELGEQLRARLALQTLEDIDVLRQRIEDLVLPPCLRSEPATLIPPGMLSHTLSGHARAVNAVAITPDGQRAVSASDDHTLKVWDLASGEEAHTLSGHARAVNAVAITPDGQRAVSASDDHTLKVWDLASGACLCGFTADAGIVCCDVSPDGRTIVAGDALGRVHILRYIEE